MTNKSPSPRQKSRTAVDRVFNDLMDKFARYEFMPGDHLPAENDLAEQYGVSRITIRTALSMLSAIGMIETRTGGGSYVKKFQFSDITDTASAIMANQVKTEDVNQFRQLIETASLNNLRGKKIISSDIKYLKGCCDRMEQAEHKGSRNEIAKADYSFHKHICKMSGNMLFIYSYDMIGSIMLAYFDKHYFMSEDLSKHELIQNALKMHRQIIDCIAGGQIDQAISINTKMSLDDVGGAL